MKRWEVSTSLCNCTWLNSVEVHMHGNARTQVFLCCVLQSTRVWELCNQILFSRFHCTRFIVLRNTRPLNEVTRDAIEFMQVIKPTPTLRREKFSSIKVVESFWKASRTETAKWKLLKIPNLQSPRWSFSLWMEQQKRIDRIIHESFGISNRIIRFSFT